jgi:MYXO-CTERM domain-containing protein
VQGSVHLSGGGKCRPRACSCQDLGDIMVDFETPRSCEVTVSAKFSGNHVVGEGGPLATSDAVASAEIHASMNGVALSGPIVADVCAGKPCNGGKAGADGTLTFIVPVIQDAPQLKLNADLKIIDGATLHYYSGSLSVAGCTREQTRLAAAVNLEVDHAAVTGIGDFIASLGAGPSSDPTDILDDTVEDPLGCGCRLGARRDPVWYAAPLALFALALALRRRRRR